MRNDLAQALYSDFPAILPKHRDDRHTPIECGSGWYAIVEALCTLMQEQTRQKPELPQHITGIKEKFGELMITTMSKTAETRAYISFAQAMSLRICEICGSPGQMILTEKWMRTRCAEHESTLPDS
ncbi:hypothetical protein BK658_28120 [Pseudomonas brassicacearum]|uniref:Uncharacterized protein n=1 Tax=Pseudomonas brassicacearum TaxID=930166 RepID=A0A423GIN3_9PSED|nr:hypothetical protein BK658_28120 [Pseudomonas brassicacearum]